MLMSDEMSEEDVVETFESTKSKLTRKQRDFINQRVLGFDRDLMQGVDSAEEQDEGSGDDENKIQVGGASVPNAKSLSHVHPLDFSKVSVSEMFREDCEHYFIKPKKATKIDCRTCRLMYDFTNVCKHMRDQEIQPQLSWDVMQALT